MCFCFAHLSLTVCWTRAFIKTFVNRVDYEHPNITVEYTIPFDTKKAEPPDDGVLPTDRNGSPIVKISNQLIEDFKKIYDLKPVLPVEALKIRNLKKENYSYLIR